MGGGRGGQPMWIINKFYNIIIKSANVDKGWGVNAYPQNVDKKTFFLEPLTKGSAGKAKKRGVGQNEYGCFYSFALFNAFVDKYI